MLYNFLILNTMEKQILRNLFLESRDVFFDKVDKESEANKAFTLKLAQDGSIYELKEKYREGFDNLTLFEKMQLVKQMSDVKTKYIKTIKNWVVFWSIFTIVAMAIGLLIALFNI